MKGCWVTPPPYPGHGYGTNRWLKDVERESLRRELHIERMENDFLRREVEMLRGELKKHGQYPFPPSSWDVYCKQDSNEAQP